MSKEEGKIIRRVVYNNHTDECIEKDYELLHVLDFDSTRKRMSVIIHDCQTNEYILYCKGADIAIFKKSIDTKEEQSKYDDCLKSFSENGWRTLVLSFKILTLEEYEYYDFIINEANNDILNREEKLLDAYEKIEKDLDFFS